MLQETIARNAADRGEVSGARARRWVTAVVAVSVLLITGCGVSFFGSLSTPSGVEATVDRTDLIELTWSEVAGADVYHVYRSLSQDGPFRAEGPMVAVPYRTVTQPTLLDANTDPTDYFYTVSAGRLSTGAESDLSGVVEGTRVAEEIGWQDQSTVFGAPGTIRLAVDRTTATIRSYVLTVGDGTGATATVRQIEADGTLTNLGGPSEPTDGTDPRVADLAAAGSVYTAIVAEDTDKPFLYRYDADLEEWLLVAGPQFDPAHPSAPFVTMVAIGADDLLISYRDSVGAMALYRFSGTLGLRLTPPADSDDLLDAAFDSIGQIDAAAVPNGAVLLYELEDDDSASPGDTTSLQVSVWDGIAWQAGTTIYNGATGNVAAGGAAIAIDPTVTPAANGTVITYLDGAALRVVDRTGAIVPDSDTGFSGAVDTTATSVGIAAQSGIISLFYLDLAEAAGVVAQFDTIESTWTQFSPPDFTQSPSATKFSISGGGGKWFTAFDDDGITRIRGYQ
jgi:hypothetical protein